MTQHKIGRNDPCRCGSGKKYKQCCQLTGAAQNVPGRLPPEVIAKAMQAAWINSQHGRLAQARAALGLPAIQPQACEDAAQFLQRATGIEVMCCPHCRLGQWRTVQLLPPLRAGSTTPTAACRGPP